MMLQINLYIIFKCNFLLFRKLVFDLGLNRLVLVDFATQTLISNKCWNNPKKTFRFSKIASSSMHDPWMTVSCWRRKDNNLL